ncbi:MAG: phosphate ABC transporter permease PstA [Anaerolineae bacterium]|jgi:phosphate transport system permease protein|nr:phosphate ABC transporter permease PstA [Anaerolineae bacterium]
MSNLIDIGVYRSDVNKRNARGNLMQRLYFSAMIIAIIVLIMLLFSIINQAFGYIAVSQAIKTEDLSDQPLNSLSSDELAQILLEQTPRLLLVMVRDNLNRAPVDQFTTTPFSQSINGTVPEDLASVTPRDLSGDAGPAAYARLLAANLSPDALTALIEANVLKVEIEKSWTLAESLFNRAAIEAEVANTPEQEELRFHSWLNNRLLTQRNSQQVEQTGIGPALAGTAYLLIMTIAISLPLGVGAAIYFEEYAKENFLNKLLETNIRNLAGVPSIIYGMLGLTVFVNTLSGITQGRTILSGALTLSLLILPIIITNSREALRAVPSTIREASYGLGATKWQTVSRQILPAALPGVLTGLILGVSRAIGETAPLIVIGATNSISTFPDGPFSRFSVLPFTIYNWSTQPDASFKNAASAAIIVLMLLLLLINATAIVLRNRAVSKRVQ